MSFRKLTVEIGPPGGQSSSDGDVVYPQSVSFSRVVYGLSAEGQCPDRVKTELNHIGMKIILGNFSKSHSYS